MQDAAVKRVNRVAAPLLVSSERDGAGVELADLTGETDLMGPDRLPRRVVVLRREAERLGVEIQPGGRAR